MLLVTADVHERGSRVPLVLAEMGVFVDVRALPRGDYVVGPSTVVERKTVIGLHRSIQEGRFWKQMGKLREAGSSPVLLIEGHSVFDGPVANNGIRGVCLSVADLGVTIIRSEDPRDTAAWLYRLAARRRDGAVRDRPVYAQRRKSDNATPAEAALSAAPGVSTVTARAVLERFGSICSLCDAAVEDIRSLQGIGRTRAEAIRSMIHDPWTTRAPTSHSVSAEWQVNGEHRAT
jgi:DNA excision repair protein ERCC-4